MIWMVAPLAHVPCRASAPLDCKPNHRLAAVDALLTGRAIVFVAGLYPAGKVAMPVPDPVVTPERMVPQT